jgi:hypothetical protein
LSEVKLFAKFVHQLQLGLQIVDMQFSSEDDLEEVRARGSPVSRHMRMPGRKSLDDRDFNREIGLEFLTDRLADVERE